MTVLCKQQHLHDWCIRCIPNRLPSHATYMQPIQDASQDQRLLLYLVPSTEV